MRLIKSILSLVFVSLICITFFSCGEDNNPVIPNSADTMLDSARFTWKQYNFSDAGFYGGLWARDTNDIFILNIFYNYVVRVKDNILTFNYYVNTQTFLGGFDKNIAFLLGTNPDSTLNVKSWNGNNFSDIGITGNHNLRVDKTFFFKPNEIWIGGNDGHINKFDGNTLTEYNFFIPHDSCFIQEIFFDSTSNKLRFTLLVDNSSFNDSIRTFYLFEFNGNEWNKISEFVYDYRIKPAKFNFYINGYLLNQNSLTIMLLNNLSFIPFCNTNGFIINYTGGGYSRNNILVNGSLHPYDPENPYRLFHWNGIKWSKEFNGEPLIETKIYSINPDFYCIVNNVGFSEKSFLLTGIKKH